MTTRVTAMIIPYRSLINPRSTTDRSHTDHWSVPHLRRIDPHVGSTFVSLLDWSWIDFWIDVCIAPGSIVDRPLDRPMDRSWIDIWIEISIDIWIDLCIDSGSRSESSSKSILNRSWIDLWIYIYGSTYGWSLDTFWIDRPLDQILDRSWIDPGLTYGSTSG